jgi:hypothetical protein
MMIAHPPCTYLSNVGAPHMFPKGVLNKERYQKMLQGKDFFMKLLMIPLSIIIFIVLLPFLLLNIISAKKLREALIKYVNRIK